MHTPNYSTSQFPLASFTLMNLTRTWAGLSLAFTFWCLKSSLFLCEFPCLALRHWWAPWEVEQAEQTQLPDTDTSRGPKAVEQGHWSSTETNPLHPGGCQVMRCRPGGSQAEKRASSSRPGMYREERFMTACESCFSCLPLHPGSSSSSPGSSTGTCCGPRTAIVFLVGMRTCTTLQPPPIQTLLEAKLSFWLGFKPVSVSQEQQTSFCH